MRTELMHKRDLLEEVLRGYKRAIVAFSGGIDSTLVLCEAVRVLGKANVLAVIANSELFSDEEYDKAVSLAEELNADVKGITIDYLANEHIAKNEPETWYHGKKIFYQRMNTIADEGNYDVVLDGMIMDDLGDFRPGLVARNEEGAVSVLQKAGFYKADVRELARELGLPNWDKVANCSISSRFPYYTCLTSSNIQRVMQSEKFIRDLGFPVVRVRCHDETAKIEVPTDRIPALIENHDEIRSKLTACGFKYVTVDMDGFRSGRMNDDLPKATRDRLTVNEAIMA